MQPVCVGLHGKRRIFGVRIRFALKGGQKIVNGSCVFSDYD
jgi:hypothetical protein